MNFILLGLFLLAGGPPITLTVEVPRADWNYVDLVIREPMTVITCDFEVITERSPVRVVWIARHDLESFRTGNRENIFAASRFGMDGKLRHFVLKSGDYALVIESQSNSHARAKVKLRISLEPTGSPKVLSPQRRMAVILISALVFVAIVSFSAFKLRGVMRRN